VLRRAAALVDERSIGTDADLGPFLQSAPEPASDFDRDVLRRLRNMYDAGAWVLRESAIADLPSDLRWLFESGAVTLDQLAALHEALGVTSAADLAAAVESEAARRVPGLGADTEYAIAAALLDLRMAVPRIPLGRATSVADPIVARLKDTPGVRWATPAGSLRRGQDTVGDIEIVAAADDPAAVIDELTQLPDVSRVLHRSARRLYLMIDRVQVGMRFPAASTAGAELLHLTGSTGHLNDLRSVARARGGRLTIEGYRAADSASSVAEHEDEIYAALGLPFIPPEIRHGDQEVEAARHGALPTLISQADIHGDLHMHSTWSDGHDSIELMALRCRELGYEYCAITDHSPHSAASRNLSVDDVKRQADEIAGVRERVPQLTIMQGCEVDILPDGRLDLPDRVLERLDFVLASLHESGGHGPDQLLRRYAAAMRHPLVNLITHPTNRLVPHRPGYDLDYERLFETARETGTILEVDGAPAHLDMDGALARRAVAAGVAIAVDSDAHRAELLERQMRLGVATARRAWIEPRHVVNTRSLSGIREIVARKRAG
jgi:DNA polymerase (family 10)